MSGPSISDLTSAGSVDVHVFNAGGESEPPTNDFVDVSQFTYDPIPVITSMGTGLSDIDVLHR